MGKLAAGKGEQGLEKVVALFCAFSMGMCFSLLGSISVKLMPRLKIDQGRFGTLISAFMFACLMTSLVVGVAIDSLGYQPVAVFGFVMTGLCIVSLAWGKTYRMILASCFLMGLGAMALSMAGMTLMPVVLFSGKIPAAASNLGNAFFGLGLLFTPLLASFLFRVTSYEKSVSALAAMVLAPVIFAILATYPKSQASFVLSDAFALLGEPAVLVAAGALFCYSSLEQSFSNWLPPFGQEVVAAAKPAAAVTTVHVTAQRLLSLFAVAMMGGRLLASQIPAITEYGSWFVAGSSLLAAGVISAMTVARTVFQVRLLAVLAGLILAPCFPTTVGITFAKFRPEMYGSIFGIISGFAMLGGVITPKVIGNLAKESSVQSSLKLLVPACMLLVVLAVVLGEMKGIV